jgi:hypothetical protein
LPSRALNSAHFSSNLSPRSAAGLFAIVFAPLPHTFR